MRKSLLCFALFLFFACGAKKDETEVQKLFSQGEAALSAGKYDSALVVYDTIWKKFPRHPKSDRALFMLGYIELEFLGNRAKGEKHLNDFIVRYPKSDLVKDAKFLLAGEMPKF